MPRQTTLEGNSSNYNIDGLDGYKFEELVAKIMKKEGYENIINTPGSKDFGKDLIMTGKNGDLVVVECKHQNFVGRPVIQKLQGAMKHEEAKGINEKIRGMVVTSGIFSKEAINYVKEIDEPIELIDGVKLKNFCKKLDIIILNGKVQIINNMSFKNISKEDSKNFSEKDYLKIYGSNLLKISTKPRLTFVPSSYVKYNVAFDTHTSIGCIDNYEGDGEMLIDGTSGEELNGEITSFYTSGRNDFEEIKISDVDNKILYDLTENDIEEYALDNIIKEHTHEVRYLGRNNVSYVKKCIPKKRDIQINKFMPVYLPLWKNNIQLKDINYNQHFYIKGNNKFIVFDELKNCKICNTNGGEYHFMSVCPECGRIVCRAHVKIDYLDNKTPICTIHAKHFKLWLQKKYFASKDNLNEYKSIWSKMNFFRKLYEDKIVFISLILGSIATILIVLKYYNI